MNLKKSSVKTLTVMKTKKLINKITERRALTYFRLSLNHTALLNKVRRGLMERHVSVVDPKAYKIIYFSPEEDE